jgi:sterol desaturase/sphingolipid hydroxylase (fatty acid hydroxylase superfamily)
MFEPVQIAINGAGQSPKGAFLLFALLFVAAEFAAARLSHHDGDHDLAETAASFGVALGDLAIRFMTAGLISMPFLFAYQRRLFDIPATGVGPWAALFFGAEFCYYWFHRASHRIRWFWATHSVHHSATRFNLSAAVRLGWTGQLTGAFVFFLPLAVIGFHPAAIALVMGLGLLYQFFLHTAFQVRLGPLEWFLNTPAHHRVHHASNESCLDRNYGSVLIIFDRLFGTFAEAPKDEALVFGLRGRVAGNNPFKIAFGEWAHLAHDVTTAKGLRRKLAVLTGRP